MSPAEAVDRLTFVLAHAWMVRNFLKHADEVQDDEELLDVHRELFDAIRAVEPAFQRGDHKEYLRRLKGKLPKLRKASEFFSCEFRRASTHTNFEMAALSMRGVVRAMEEIFAAVRSDVPTPAEDVDVESRSAD